MTTILTVMEPYFLSATVPFLTYLYRQVHLLFTSSSAYIAKVCLLEMPSPTSKNSCVSDLNSFQPVTVEPNTTVDLRGCRVLAVDDDPVALRALQKHLQNKGCAVTTASDGESGLESITEDTSVALIDLRMPGLDGLECLHRIKKKFPALPVIILTASSEIASAVKAMKAGAFQYITKPFDPESLSVHVQKAHTSWQLSKENSGLRDAHGLPEPVRKLPTERTAMGTELLSSIQRISELNSTVFIGGESGTGKTTVARLIHQNGPRAKKPFVLSSCGIIVHHFHPSKPIAAACVFPSSFCVCGFTFYYFRVIFN